MASANDAVRILVHRPPVDVYPDASLRAVAETMRDETIGVVIVRAPHPHGSGTRAAGLVSERDIVQAIADGSDLDRTRAEDVMTDDLASARPDEPIRDAAMRMIENDIRHLPVLDDDDVVGVLSLRDVVEALLGDA
jgi:CBS domain-containing protein